MFKTGKKQLGGGQPEKVEKPKPDVKKPVAKKEPKKGWFSKAKEKNVLFRRKAKEVRATFRPIDSFKASSARVAPERRGPARDSSARAEAQPVMP